MPELYKFFGVEKTLTTGVVYMLKLKMQWEAHCAAFVPRAADAPQMTKLEVYEYWEALSVAASELSGLATLHCLRPLSSASVERIFSLLSQIDTPSRRSMGPDMLYNTLFLRANWRVVDELLHEMGDEIRSLEKAATGARDSELRKRLRTAVESASASAAASASAGADAGGAGDSEAELDLS